MPKFGNFIANIEVDKNALPEYDVRVEDNEKLVSCWVPSEAGKTFSVCWQNLEPSTTDTGGDVTIDGISVGGRIRYKGSKIKTEYSEYLTSATTCCGFSFSRITYTGSSYHLPLGRHPSLTLSHPDDDAYLNTTVSNLGEIKLEVWSIVIGEKIPVSERTVTSDMKVHERSKKLGAHRVKFDTKTVAPTQICSATSTSRMATFIFTYRPLDILQANGIAPLPAPAEQERGNNKRKTPEDDVDIKEEASDEEDDLDDRVQKLKDELKRLESRRSKKRKVKVKKEDRPPIINEVVDLT
ncbi:hypothetical protein APHAL10511_007638 [Amanita phalloides]|nr:hypothetical protein APHAL10511_007638 [Amanita phalloides]